MVEHARKFRRQTRSCLAVDLPSLSQKRHAAKEGSDDSLERSGRPLDRPAIASPGQSCLPLYWGAVARSPPRVPSPASDWPKVALLVETSLAPGRDILRGIARYVREEGPWSIAHEPRTLEQSVPRWLRRWKGDGIIARVLDQRIARVLASSGVPIVDVLGVVEGLPFPLVHVDDEAIGRLGAEHLLDVGFRRFGFFGIDGENWSHRRADAFARRVQAAGYACVSYGMSRQTARQERWEDSEKELTAWLAALPKPAGVMIATDQLGPHTLEACRRAGVNVPDDVGVVGVDNDGPLCEVSNPPLSSVWPDHRRVGYEAARLLAEMMRGTPAPRRPLFLPPREVRVRKSTGALAIEDREVAQALRFIREQGCGPIDVEDVVRIVPLSRSVLQRRFRALLGRSVHDEIVRLRLARARELLQETDLPLAEIAERAGFRHQEYMGAVFRRRLHVTPGSLRRSRWRR
jgi:LacI family transcriptional regulator